MDVSLNRSGCDTALRKLDRLSGWLSHNGLERIVMLEYRVYVIGNDGRIIERIDLECPNDAKAVSDGKTYARKHDVEIWCGQRVVTVLHPLT